MAVARHLNKQSSKKVDLVRGKLEAKEKSRVSKKQKRELNV